MYKLNTLTIGIISYNRPVQLLRALKSLLPLPLDVEVLICDDKSPKIEEIKSTINDLILKHSNIKFIQNETNLGYDKNLYQLISLCKTEFILLLGDDDFLEFGAIENLTSFIKNTKNFSCGFLRFKSESDNNYRRFYDSDIYFNKSYIASEGSFIYNSILFSGLVFNRNVIIEDSSKLSRFFNSIYIQVAMFVFSHIKYGSYYISGPGIIIGGDGESGFGFNEASISIDSDLKDRTSIISNIPYHKRLFEVLKSVNSDLDFDILQPFVFEYKIRCIKALFVARKFGRKYLKIYWEQLISLNVDGFLILYPIYLLIYVLPSNFFEFPFRLLEGLIINYRKNKT